MTEDLLEQINIDLSSQGFFDINFEKNELFCKTIIELHEISFRCNIPATFPYEFPAVYIDEKCYEKIAPLPHVGNKNDICTFDKVISLPNFKYPDKVIAASLKKARNIIRMGILGLNKSDFDEEFNAYWAKECDAHAYSIFMPTTKTTMLKCYMHKGEAYIGLTKLQLDKYLHNIGIGLIYDKNYFDCLYLPLSINLRPPFPKSNYDFYAIVKRDKENYEIYYNYLMRCLPNRAFIAFSLEYMKKRHLQLIMHTNISSKIDGFRKKHVPVGIAYSMDKYQKPPIKFLVTDMSQERLYSRGGTGLTGLIEKVALIGCGSVGSYIVEALSEYGISNFVLVDNDVLSAENIARHYCGYNYIGKSKVSAINAALTRHNPNVESTLFSIDGHQFLDCHNDQINTCDLLIEATASSTIEYKILELLLRQEIKIPTVLIWVEPYLVAGHAIIINKPHDIFSELFDKELKFKYSVILNADGYSKKEAGCQSTYFPYSAFTLKRFIYTFLDYLLNSNIAKKKNGNYVYTWIGNLSEATRNKIEISPSWISSEDFSEHIKRID